MAQGKIREDFLEANQALLHAHSLVEISQESYTDPESENIYNLLDILGEKINIARKFFDDYDLCWATGGQDG